MDNLDLLLIAAMGRAALAPPRRRPGLVADARQSPAGRALMARQEANARFMAGRYGYEGVVAMLARPACVMGIPLPR
jgi:hypothetical protein